jgi:hypothetical protein
MMETVPSGRSEGSDMDERRFEELKEKRRVKGLTDDEADELGRLFAEEAGKPYSNARGGMQETEAPRG